MDSREQFENAVENDFEKPTFTAMERDGDGYMDSYVDNAWWGWKACQELNNKMIAELEAKLKVATEHLGKIHNGVNSHFDAQMVAVEALLKLKE